MNQRDLSFLCCPNCRGDLEFSISNQASIATSQNLHCPSCRKTFPIIKNVPVLLTDFDRSSDEKMVMNTFGRRWTENLENMRDNQFFYTPSLVPLKPEDFRGKIIIDAGCGFGPLTKFLLDNGAKHVIGIDFSSAVFAADTFLQEFRDKITLVRGDVQAPPIKPIADMFISHGVLIHVKDGKKAYHNLSELIRPQKGTSLIWVYSQERNRWLKLLLDFIRLFSLRLPFRLNWLMAHILDFFLTLIVFCFYKPAENFLGIGKRLWFGEYFLDYIFNPQKGGTKKYRINMIHDALCTPIANHFSKKQLKNWVLRAGYVASNFNFFRDQSWTVVASYCIQEKWNDEHLSNSSTI